MNTTKNKGTRRERIYSELVSMIMSGELSMGEAIDEKVLIERLSVSRTPFREAIGTLEKQGLIEIRAYKGFFVRSFSAEEIGDLYDLRAVLESFAVRLAVSRLRNIDLPVFEAILDGAVNALTRGDMVEYAARDRAFHETIATLSSNHALVDALSRLALQIQMCRVVANQGEDFPQRAAQERDEILDALRKRDAERASALMEKHILDVKGAVLEWLSKHALPGNGGTGVTRDRTPRAKVRS